MEILTTGTLIKGVGGLYSIQISPTEEEIARTRLAPQTLLCRARGTFRHENVSPLIGDEVEIRCEESAFATGEDGLLYQQEDTGGILISRILPRRNALIRPAMANLDYLFVAMAAASPAPMLNTVDKLLSIAEFNHVEPLLIVGKCELDREMTDRLTATYQSAGYRVFPVSCVTGEGVDAVRSALQELLPGRTAAFAGASGVGKSSLLNALFPDLHLETSEISRKVERGRHTTRHVELFPVWGGYLADTPGFSMLDFVRFDFFDKEDLPETMREFRPLLGQCRYTKCTHTKEQGCAIVDAVKDGSIAKSRHQSFVSLYEILKKKTKW
jgi:ribosome biogenesis GTPase